MAEEKRGEIRDEAVKRLIDNAQGPGVKPRSGIH